MNYSIYTNKKDVVNPNFIPPPQNPLKKIKTPEYIIYREITYGFFKVTEKTIKVHKNGKKEIIKIETY